MGGECSSSGMSSLTHTCVSLRTACSQRLQTGPLNFSIIILYPLILTEYGYYTGLILIEYGPCLFCCRRVTRSHPADCDRRTTAWTPSGRNKRSSSQPQQPHRKGSRRRMQHTNNSNQLLAPFQQRLRRLRLAWLTMSHPTTVL